MESASLYDEQDLRRCRESIELLATDTAIRKVVGGMDFQVECSAMDLRGRWEASRKLVLRPGTVSVVDPFVFGRAVV